MPALWQSSERPMYVKTVWVDGFRHAILTRDDPYLLKLNAKKKRPHSSVSYAGACSRDPRQLTVNKFRKTRLSHNEDQLEDCIRKLDFVIKRDKIHIHNRVQARGVKESKEDIEKLNLTELESESEEELVLKANPQPLNDFESSRSKFNTINADMKTVRSNRTPKIENTENNELSERVLQWLDLAGKIDMLAPVDDARISQPRHSWPEIQKRNLQMTKSKTVTDLKTPRAKASDSPKLVDSGIDKAETAESFAIDRHELSVTTPANTIENYARQSRTVKDASRNAAKKVRESLNVTKGAESRPSVEQTRQKIANEIQAVERQYAELINKKIIPNYNKQGAKRQVHIFVPAVPKKPNASVASSRTESLLSHKT